MFLSCDWPKYVINLDSNKSTMFHCFLLKFLKLSLQTGIISLTNILTHPVKSMINYRENK